MTFTKAVYTAIGRSLGTLLPEQGGILGGRDGVICAFFHDTSARCTRAEYHPDTAALNRVIAEWSGAGISFMGIIHSHEAAARELSGQDLRFARSILDANPAMESLAFPLVLPRPGGFELLPCRITRENVLTETIYINQ